MPKLSAGLLVYRLVDGEPEVLLVHPGGPYWAKKDDGAWSVPKGEHEPDEVPLEVAVREFEEEIGKMPPDPAGALSLGELHQPSGKIVSAWAVEGDIDVGDVHSNTFEMEWPPRSGRAAEFPEVDRAGWFGLEEARRKLLRGQLGFIDRLSELLDGGPAE
ncbi:MAG: NUDIX domain-containing protein [Actinobacteria bacterium]|nr:NUDIX domain-containing protein [Actinomycetota bacterium]